MEVLARAADLNDKGRFRAALELLQPLLDSKTQKLDHAIVGVAWNIRGLALQDLGNLDDARRSYETAIQILRGTPEQTIQYATALNNLGSLEADEGLLSESKKLRIRARELFESVSDHAGASRTSCHLALVALGLGNRTEARRYLADANYDEALVSSPDVRDLAWMFGTESMLDEADGNFQAALDPINRAIDLWTHHYGPKYYALAMAYAVRGRLYQRLRDDSHAGEDLENSLILLTENDQTDSKVYFSTKIMYAQVLRDLGKKEDASRMESEARSALQRLRHQQCAGCTISAQGIR